MKKKYFNSSKDELISLQLRIFERDALELSAQYEMWEAQLQSQNGLQTKSAGGSGSDGNQKETEQQLKNLHEHVSLIQTQTFEVAQRGRDLLGTFERSGITLMADSQYNGQTRVQVLLDYIQERQMDIEDLAAIRRIRLEQCVQLCQFESDANQASTLLLP